MTEESKGERLENTRQTALLLSLPLLLSPGNNQIANWWKNSTCQIELPGESAARGAGGEKT